MKGDNYVGMGIKCSTDESRKYISDHRDTNSCGYCKMKHTKAGKTDLDEIKYWLERGYRILRMFQDEYVLMYNDYEWRSVRVYWTGIDSYETT